MKKTQAKSKQDIHNCINIDDVEIGLSSGYLG